MAHLAKLPMRAPQPNHEWGSRDEDAFTQIEMVGEGTYGMVFKSKDLESGEICALKKIRMEGEKEGFPLTALREIKILKSLKHVNVVELREIVRGKVSSKNEIPSFYLSFECLDHDLAGLLESPSKQFITEPIVKCYFRQLLEGLAYLHRNRIIHRDLKTANILLSHQGILKICDFGLARPFQTDSKQKYTNKVITLWYRPPELLLGGVQYGPEVDIWSAGCILTEMLDKKPMFPANDDATALDMIFKLMGTPTEEQWPELYVGLKPKFVHKNAMKEKYSHLSPVAVIFIERLLTINPTKRPTAHDALDDNWLWSAPMPVDPQDIPKFPPAFDHMFRKKQKRKLEENNQNPEAQKRQKTEDHRYPMPSATNVVGVPHVPNPNQRPPLNRPSGPAPLPPHLHNQGASVNQYNAPPPYPSQSQQGQQRAPYPHQQRPPYSQPPPHSSCTPSLIGRAWVVTNAPLASAPPPPPPSRYGPPSNRR